MPPRFALHVKALSLFSLVLTMVLLAILQTGCEGSSTPSDDALVLGAQVYNAQCLACHRADGAGIPAVYPPLTGPDSWTTGPQERLIRLLLHGLEGALVMDGTTYNNVMLSYRHLSDEELAAVLTYIRKSWGHDASSVTATDIAKTRLATQNRTQAWTPEALNATPDSN